MPFTVGARIVATNQLANTNCIPKNVLEVIVDVVCLSDFPNMTILPPNHHKQQIYKIGGWYPRGSNSNIMSPLPHIQELNRLSCEFIEVQILYKEGLASHLSLFQNLQQCFDSHDPIELPSTLGTIGEGTWD